MLDVASTIAIYTTSNGVLLKIFDSHARYLFGMADAQGTCVFL